MASTDAVTLANGEEVRKPRLQSVNTLFRAVDADASGQIDQSEFGKLYELIKAEVEAEIEKEQKLEKEVKTEKRRLKAAVCLGLLLLCFLGVSIAANFVVVTMVVDAAKDTKVNETVSAMMTKGGEPVSTGTSISAFAAEELPRIKDMKTYNSMTMMDYSDGVKKVSGRIMGWEWYSEELMVLKLATDADLLIYSELGVTVVNTTGVIDFDNAGAAVVMGEANGVTAADASAKCAALACPLSKCELATSAVVGIRTVTCADTLFFTYSDDWHSEAARRKLAFDEHGNRRKLFFPMVAAVWAYRAYQVAGFLEGVAGVSAVSSSGWASAGSALGALGALYGCFKDDSMVTLANHTMVPMHTIKKGDMVWTGSKAGKVTDVLTHPVEASTVPTAVVATPYGELVGTADHPVFVNGQWLEIGAAHRTGLLKAVKFEDRAIDVWWNLEVDGDAPGTSEHAYVVNGVIASGLGDNEVLNSRFPRQDVWKAKTVEAEVA